jgi:hypothetical protein
MFSTYERPTMIERGSFTHLTRGRWGRRRDFFRGRQRRRCGDGDWDD